MNDRIPDRLLMRVERLVTSIRKINSVIKDNPDVPNKDRLMERRDSYQAAILNIQEHGREVLPKRIVGTKIEVPADVLVTRSK